MVYNQQFQERAAANFSLAWANIGQASVSCCCCCFCLSHTTDHCDWAPDPPSFKTNSSSSSRSVHCQYVRPGTMTLVLLYPTALRNIFVGTVTMISTKPSTAMTLAMLLQYIIINLYLVYTVIIAYQLANTYSHISYRSSGNIRLR